MSEHGKNFAEIGGSVNNPFASPNAFANYPPSMFSIQGFQQGSYPGFHAGFLYGIRPPQTTTLPSPVALNHVINLDEDKGKVLAKPQPPKQEGKEEDKSFGRWDDVWTTSLIHIRGGMADEFSKPPKQGIDLWKTVLTKLVAVCPKFDKDSEACRKKWMQVNKQYAKDRQHNSISGNDRREFKFYKLIDEYMGTRANVSKAVHGGAINEEEEKIDLVDVTGNKENVPTKRVRRDNKKNNLLVKLEEGRKEMLEKFDFWEAKRLKIMESMNASFKELVKKL